MSTSSDSDNQIDSEYPDSYMPSSVEPPPQPQRNKVQELIEDNKQLRDKMRQTATEMDMKRQELEQFYSRLKTSARHVLTSLNQSQDTITAKKKEITFLKAEKLRLQIILNERGTSNMNLNDPACTNGDVDAEFKNDYEDTLESLVNQLRQAEEDKQRAAAERELEVANFRVAWEQNQDQMTAEFENMRDFYNNQRLQQSREIENYQGEMRKAEQENASLKGQVKSLIAEHQADQKSKDVFELQCGQLRQSFQEKERQNFRMQKEMEELKIKRKSLEDELIRHKQELEEVKHQRNEKEKSLDQLFEVYNTERVERQKMEKAMGSGAYGPGQSMMEFDKVYAQYICAEESIKKKNDEILKLRKEMDSNKDESATQISIYKQQADIFKKDFEMEREARQKQHSECENLKTMVGQYQMEMQRMKQDLMRYQPYPASRPPPNY